MKKLLAFLALVVALFVLGACAGTETAPARGVGESSAATPEVVVYHSPT